MVLVESRVKDIGIQMHVVYSKLYCQKSTISQATIQIIVGRKNRSLLTVSLISDLNCTAIIVIRGSVSLIIVLSFPTFNPDILESGFKPYFARDVGKKNYTEKSLCTEYLDWPNSVRLLIVSYGLNPKPVVGEPIGKKGMHYARMASMICR